MATTTAINFGSLVGAQVSALIEAEVEGAEKAAEFIEKVGFEQVKEGPQRLRMVTFEMPRRDVDGKVRKHTISIPVLTLVPIPLLTIEEASIEFDLHVESVEQIDTKESVEPTTTTLRRSLLAESPLQRVRLVTRLARTTHQDTQTTSDLKMKIKIAQSPFPLGIERLINTADLSVGDDPGE